MGINHTPYAWILHYCDNCTMPGSCRETGPACSGKWVLPKQAKLRCSQTCTKLPKYCQINSKKMSGILDYFLKALNIFLGWSGFFWWFVTIIAPGTQNLLQ